jgi:hypothetical protein
MLFRWSMNLDGQRTNRVLGISLLVLILSTSCHSWHKTLTFVQQLSYEFSKIKHIYLVYFDFIIHLSFWLFKSDDYLWYEIFYVVSILCYIWCTWNINFIKTWYTQFYSKLFFFKYNFLNDHSGWNLRILLAYWSINDGWMSSRMEY